MKTCSYCKEIKDEDNFIELEKDGEVREALCKICRANKSRENHHKYIDESLSSRAALTRFLTNHFKTNLVRDCGKSFPACAMDYDHFKG